MKIARHLSDPRKTPQNKPLARRRDVTRNAAGGYAFKVGDWERLDRFLIIGTEGGTYYASERQLTLDNVEVVQRCLDEDRERTLQRAIEVSDQGLAPKNDPAILALALTFSRSVDHWPLRDEALLKVCRTGTHLFQFLSVVKQLRGGGRGLNRAVRLWIEAKPTDKLALQVCKYRQREGWTWKDVFRRYRPKPPTEVGPLTDSRAALYAFVAAKPHEAEKLPSLASAFLQAQEAEPEALVKLIHEHKLPWEFVPSGLVNEPSVLRALFDYMPPMALVRNLSRLETRGVLEKVRGLAHKRLTDQEALRKARIHPVAFLLAALAYEKGEGRHLTWTPNARTVDALSDGFQAALKVAEPTGKRILVAVDSSGSMHWPGNGPPLLKLATAMALTYVVTDGAEVMAFDTQSKTLPLSARQRLNDAVRAVERLGMGGGTDCSLPFKYALSNDLVVDAFVVLTDNETWAGNQWPAQALAKYRRLLNPKAKVVWCAMTANNVTCGDPEDRRMLSIAGFDASAPKLVSNFVADRF